MSYRRIFNPRALPIAMFLILTVFFCNRALQASDPSSDACAMLPGAQLAKVLDSLSGRR